MKQKKQKEQQEEREQPKERNPVNQLFRDREERLFRAGLCTQCGKQPHEPGHRMCIECNMKRKTAKALKHQEEMRKREEDYTEWGWRRYLNAK